MERMMGKSTHGRRNLSETEKAANKNIDGKPPNKGTDACSTFALGNASGGHHKIAQSCGKEKPIAPQVAPTFRSAPGMVT
jgi:hypothetical protein